MSDKVLDIVEKHLTVSIHKMFKTINEDCAGSADETVVGFDDVDFYTQQVHNLLFDNEDVHTAASWESAKCIASNMQMISRGELKGVI